MPREQADSKKIAPPVARKTSVNQYPMFAGDFAILQVSGISTSVSLDRVASVVEWGEERADSGKS